MAAYRERFVAVLKCGGRILREHDGVVTLPFGSEYSVLCKNMESRKALIGITIDGQDVLNGRKLIVDPNSEWELERFVESLDSGNRFRFIQKTKQIADHRGDHVDDGIVRVEFTFEQQVEEVIRTRHIHHDHHHHHDPHHHHYHPPWWKYPYITWTSQDNVRYTSDGGTGDQTGDVLRGEALLSCNLSNSGDSIQCSNSIGAQLNYVDQITPKQDEGITVKGSESHQRLTTGTIGLLETNAHVIILRLRGTTSTGAVVEKPVTTKTKLHCGTCGQASKSSAKFCDNCGTAVI